MGSDEVIIILGDTIADYDVKEIINSPVSMLGIKKLMIPGILVLLKLMKREILPGS